MANSYYAGDHNYAGGDSNYGAGGIFGFLGKVASGLFRATPLGSVVSSVLTPPSPQSRALIGPSVPTFGPGTPMSFPEPGIRGTVHRLAPGGHPGYGRQTKSGGFTERRRPRMDVGNMKALRRANRRAQGFLKAYKRAVSYYVPKAHKGKAYVHFKKRK